MNYRFRFRVFDSNGIMTYLTGFAIPDFVKEGDGELNFVGLQGGFGGQVKGKLKDFQLMQCTGLKDKNGKLIYEGDVVKGAEMNCGVTCPDVCLVEWDDEITGFAPINMYDCDCCIYNEAECMEVIGNIYENPELLRKRRTE